jgi:fatty acid omega-hydroxylase
MTSPEAAWTEAMKYENRPNPYPFFDELRKTPVVQVADDTYVVTGYRELLTLAHDPRISSDISRSPVSAKPAADTAPPAGAEHLEAYGPQPSFIMTDPPGHDKARRQVMRHFAPPHSPDVIPKMEPDIQQLCNELLDKVKAKGENRFDVVDDYAYPVPVAVICKILGVPLKDEPTFHGWIHDFMVGTDLGPEAATEEGQARLQKGRESMAALNQYMSDLIRGYLREPGEGLLSNLVNDKDGPDGPMPPKQATSNAMLMLIAGHDSTVNTIAHCVLTLLRNPESLDLLRDRPELIPRAIEEVLRLQSAVQFFPTRSATDDIEIGGTVIPKGSAVHLLYGAANRDPRRFPDPTKFDPERPDNEHVGWGRGVHSCVGGPLARLEVNLAVENFLRRVENPRLVVDPPPYRPNQVFRGPRHLLVDFDRILD